MKKQDQCLIDISSWLVAFVRAAVLDLPVKESLPVELDWEALYALSAKQKLSAITWKGICISNCTIPSDIREKWEHQAQYAVSREVRFDYEYELIVQEFNRAEIPYVPLKGKLIRSFWPGKGLREFSDIDILVHAEDQKRAGEIMMGLGYTADHIGGMHDVYKKAPIYNVELHERLFESFIEFGHHFDNIWERVEPAQNGTFAYQMTPVDFYLHFLLHFLKHCLNSGAGLRFFVDLFLIRNSGFLNDDILSQVHSIIRELNLWEDLSKIYQITDDLFVNNCSISQNYCEYIFSGSAYGGIAWRIHNGIEKDGKFKYILKRIFMPYKYMCARYKILKYLPFLLPFAWVYRWIHHLLAGKHRKNIASEIRGVRKSN